MKGLGERGWVDAGRVVPDAIRKRHARKFFVGVLVVMLVAGSVGAYGYTETQRQLEADVRDRVTSTAQLQADGLDSWMTGLRRQTRTLSGAKQFQNGHVEEIDLYLMSRRGSMGESVAAVHYVDVSTGAVLSSTDRDRVGSNLLDAGAAWSPDEVDAETDDASAVHVASDPYRSPTTGERVVSFVSAPPSNTEHAVVVEASLRNRVNALHQTTDGGYTRIVDPSGEAVLSSANGTDGPGVNETALFRNATGGDAPGFAVGDESVVGYAAVENADWAVLTYVPKERAYGLRDSVGTSLLATVLATLAVLGVAAVGFGRSQTRTLERLTATAERMEDGDLDAELATDRIDEFGRLYAAFDRMRRSLREQIDSAERAREEAEKARAEAERARAEAEQARDAVERERREAEAAREEAEALSTRLEATAEEYREVMAECADGDLNCRLDPEGREEAMAEVAVAFNEVIAEWGRTIREVRAFARRVAAESETATERMSAVSESGAAVNESVAEISDGAADQSDHLRSVAAETNDLTETAREVSAVADETAERTASAAERGQTGRESAAAAIEDLDEIQTTTENTVAEAEQLHDLVADIEDVTEFITDIADQTNLLALNASIEAARAGEAGSGFAVVADEVKSLAEETRDATDEIEATIERVREQTDATVEGVRETRAQVAEGTETVAEALDALDAVVDEVAEANRDVQRMSDATEQQAESAREVVAMVEEVAAISEETTAEAETVAAASREQTEALADATDGVAELADRADELAALLAEFDVGEDGDDSGVVDDGDGDGRGGDSGGGDDGDTDDGGSDEPEDSTADASVAPTPSG
jgi:methyl-accepting chemotaxis protein